MTPRTRATISTVLPSAIFVLPGCTSSRGDLRLRVGSDVLDRQQHASQAVREARREGRRISGHDHERGQRPQRRPFRRPGIDAIVHLHVQRRAVGIMDDGFDEHRREAALIDRGPVARR